MKAGVQRRRWILTIAAIAVASAASAADSNWKYLDIDLERRK